MFGLDDVAGFLSGPIGQLGGKLLGGFLDNSAATDRQDAAQAFSAQQYATRYQTQVKDMQAAGLNPMLAYTQAPGNSPGGVVSTPGNQYGSAMESVLQSKLNSAQVANLNADVENKHKTAQLLEAQTAATWATAGQTNENVKLIQATVNKTVQEVENMKTDQQKVMAVIDNLAAEREKLIKEGRNLDDVQSQLKATVAKLMAELPVLRSEVARNMAAAGASSAAAGASIASAGKSQAETALLHLDKEAADKFNNMGRNMGQAKPVFDILNSVLRAGKGK